MSNSRRDFLTSSAAAVLGQAALSSSSQIRSFNNEGRPGRELPRIRVHADGHYLQTENGAPFFWLGDTAWQLIHATTREECSYYLRARADQGFTVIQTVALSEFGGVTKPSALGLLPFQAADPQRPNEAYFDRIVEIVAEAGSLGLYVALVPTWGDKLTAPWGTGPKLFRNDNLPVARAYARYVAQKLRGRTNVIWVLGGDRPARLPGMKNEYLQNIAKQAGFDADQDWTPIWREFALGITEGSESSPLITYHPQGGPESSSQYLHGEKWLSVNGMQSGHGGGHDVPVWSWIARDYALNPAKPTLDLEPNYEDHPYNPWPQWNPANGFFRDHDARKQVYRSVFAGGCGVTYGHNSIWGFIGERNPPIMYVDRDWVDALYRPGGRQMMFLRRLVESRPYFSRVPDQNLIFTNEESGARHMQATRDREGSFAFVFVPSMDQSFTVDLSKLSSSKVRAWWYDTRTGVGTLIGIIDRSPRGFTTPPHGPDWVLVLDADDAGFPPPGLEKLAI